MQARFSDLTEQVREAFAGIRVVKAYGQEAWAHERVSEAGREYIAENMSLAKTLSFFFPMMAIFTNVGLAIVIWLGGRLTILGYTTTGDFVAFISYLNLLTWPMMAMGWVTNLLQRGSASMRRINRILDEVPEILDPPDTEGAFRDPMACGVQRPPCPLSRTGRGCSEKSSVRMEPGETIALVGVVDRGKARFCRSYPASWMSRPCTVYIDGVDIREIPSQNGAGKRRLRTPGTFHLFGYGPEQRPFRRYPCLMSASMQALRAADIFDDIQTFENGLDTMLGERGRDPFRGPKAAADHCPSSHSRSRYPYPGRCPFDGGYAHGREDLEPDPEIENPQKQSHRLAPGFDHQPGRQNHRP